MILLVRAGSHVPDQILDYLQIEFKGISTILYTLLAARMPTTPILGASALENAVEDENLSLCSLLLDHKAPLNYHGRSGMTCLQRAARENDLLLTRFLFEHGADVNFAAHEDGGRTALQSAVEYNATPVVEFLLSVGADIRAAPAKRNGVTVLEALAKSYTSILNFCEVRLDAPRYVNMEDILSKLGRFRNWVAKGAPINRPNGEDGKLLHYFVLNFNHACLEEALVLGAKTDARCHEGQDEEDCEGWN
ncbi:ankyrin repeat-containing domain protein [Colletotrichum phormii]|uniref:Ankyrin repeat-containing domain protein n=1 Tax=Colletotrichum phormii TaxID=359342 RepID=A0AAI9ZJC4_9PEZI|nr:ankyrin repeat-containing domain protein [Colletotrichum phormii]KAK1625571.1 ankyrin repeat-containing domain protein [Colletotrichum phormii]